MPNQTLARLMLQPVTNVGFAPKEDLARVGSILVRVGSCDFVDRP